MAPKISVVIGTYNQKEILRRVLEGFNTQTLAREDFEVIVVDSSSTDGTDELFNTFEANFNFRPIIQENNGKTAARNRGVADMNSDLILITDADMIPHPDLLKRHVDEQERTGHQACFEGLTYDLKHLHWPPEDHLIMPYIKADYKEGKKLGWFYFLTGNISIPKPIFESFGGFDKTFKGYGWEDLELGYRMSKKKVPLYYLKSAINYHYHVITKDEEIERNVKKGESAQIFLKLHPELKWFLGLNPISKFIFPRIEEHGPFYSWVKKSCYSYPETTKKHAFGFWFLKEFYYLRGLLSK